MSVNPSIWNGAFRPETPLTHSALADKRSYTELWEDSSCVQLLPLLLTLRVLGVLPLSRSKSGGLSFKLVSLASLYSLLVYVCALFLLWYGYVINLISPPTSDRHFYNTVNRSSILCYHTLCVFIPLTFWNDAPTISQFLESWARFEVKHSAVTKTVVTTSLRRWSWFAVIVSFSSALILELTYQLYVIPPVNPVTLSVNVYQTFLRFLLSAYFHLICLALVRLARQLRFAFVTNVNKSAEYRRMWLELSRLVENTVNCQSSIIGFFLLYLLLNITLYMYQCFTDGRNAMNVEGTLTMAIQLYLVCNDGYLVHKHVVDEFQKMVFSLRMSLYKPYLQNQLELFLKMLQANASAVDLGGYVTLNRRLLVSLGSAMTTYLVVLIQFQMSDGSKNSYGYRNLSVT